MAFRLSEASGTWGEGSLHSFTSGTDGQSPVAGLVLDGKGNAYGMTSEGGDSNCTAFGQPGCGVVYEITGFAPTEH